MYALLPRAAAQGGCTECSHRASTERRGATACHSPCTVAGETTCASSQSPTRRSNRRNNRTQAQAQARQRPAGLSRSPAGGGCGRILPGRNFFQPADSDSMTSNAKQLMQEIGPHPSVNLNTAIRLSQQLLGLQPSKTLHGHARPTAYPMATPAHEANTGCALCVARPSNPYYTKSPTARNSNQRDDGY